VLLILVHKRVPSRTVLLSVSTGWHMHLDVLEARLRSDTPTPFWDGYAQLKSEYDRRLSA